MSGESCEEPSLLCYNQGCGQYFKASENTPTSCKFHPGTHFFHDAYKGWTCCRKSVDFTEFLNFKGCAFALHSNVKPPEVEKKQEILLDETLEISQPVYVPLERPPLDSTMIQLKASLSESLKKQTYQNNDNVEENIVETEVKVGVTLCVNKGCTEKFNGPVSDKEICKYHPGVPIFHEGLKYWSCCQKKTTEFDVFLKQVGCQTGSHVWIKKRDNTDDGERVKCRHDWHQDGSNVIIVVYGGGKKFDPSKSIVKANPVKLSVDLFFPEENGHYREEWILGGIIEVDASSVQMTPMKIEIKMKKAEPVKWSSLDIPQEKLATLELKEEEKVKDVGVEPVDLSDL